ncbi:MAG: tRNA (adenosine(37)-N6)-threonylcarbamoyltransferase complex dimerization subunit type 1 TsaB [Acidobacteriota bacterium]
MAELGSLPGNGPLLIVNGVTPRLGITLGRPGAPSLHRSTVTSGSSAETLAPLIAELLAEAGCAPAELGGIACVRGPGSFTGIRVALATVLGLSRGCGVPMAGLDYLPLLAATAARLATGVVVAITYARTGQVYLQTFLADGELMPMGEPVALTVAQAALRLAEAAAVGPLHLVGEGAARSRDAFLAAAPLATILGPETDEPHPEVVLAAAARARYSHAPLEPLYLRPCDAEENLADFAALRGLSAEEAQERVRQATSTI